MLSWLILAVISFEIGHLLQKFYDIDGWLSKFVFILFIIVLALVSLVFGLMGGSNPAPPFYTQAVNLMNLFKQNGFMQVVVLAFVLAMCFLIDGLLKQKTILPKTKVTGLIIKFTKMAMEGDIVSIIAGDMDFLGHIVEGASKDIPTDINLMDDSEEYRELLKKSNKVQLRIICNHKLHLNQKQAILNRSVYAEDYYTKFSEDNKIHIEQFQQLLRIGKIRTDFGPGVQIRFYNNDGDDIKYRARFIEHTKSAITGIQYEEVRDSKKRIHYGYFIGTEKNKNPIKIWKIKVPFIYKEQLYKVHEYEGKEIDYYKQLYELMWESNKNDDAEIIGQFCEQLYSISQRKKNRYRMALVYVNSYEIARKGKKRKEFPPFGVLYLAAVVRKENWEVDIKAINETDYKLDFKDYDAVGFSIVSSYAYIPLKNCCNNSEFKETAVRFAGGYQAEKFSENVFQNFHNLRVIFTGESELSIRQFVNYFKDREFHKVNGIIYKDNIGKRTNRKPTTCVDLDRIPEPARDLLPEEDVVMTNRLANTKLRMVHMLFSRGCPMNCFYCGANKNGTSNRIRYRDKNKIVDELRSLKRVYDIDGFSIIDDCFLTDSKKAVEICEHIAKADLDLKWSLTARVDQISDETLEALVNAGCIEIKFGLETGSDTLLEKMHKGTDVKTARKAIQDTFEKGIMVKVFIITGLPFENDDTHKETKAFLEEMKDMISRISLLRFTPLAGSYIYEHPEEFGIDSKKIGVENFDKMSLYRQSTDWWIDPKRKEDCQRWYEDLRGFINSNWPDDADQ